jgi:hypothetical protein
MEDTATPSEQVAPEIVVPDGAASVIGGVPVDQDGNALVIDDSTDQPQPDQPDKEAEVTPEDSPTEPVVEESKSVDQETKDLLDWATKKGIPTEEPTPAVIKALKLARESEQTYHKGQQQQSELRKSLEAFSYPQQPQQPPVQPQYDPYSQGDNEFAPTPPPQQQPQGIDPRDLKIAMLDFKISHPDYVAGSELDNALGELVGQRPDFWLNNLDQAYEITKSKMDSGSFEARLEAAKEEARREERERLTAKSKLSQPAQQSTSGKKNVQDFSKLTPENLDAFVAQANTAEYAKRRNEVNAVLASL